MCAKYYNTILTRVGLENCFLITGPTRRAEAWLQVPKQTRSTLAAPDSVVASPPPYANGNETLHDRIRLQKAI